MAVAVMRTSQILNIFEGFTPDIHLVGSEKLGGIKSIFPEFYLDTSKYRAALTCTTVDVASFLETNILDHFWTFSMINDSANNFFKVQHISEWALSPEAFSCFSTKMLRIFFL